MYYHEKRLRQVRKICKPEFVRWLGEAMFGKKQQQHQLIWDHITPFENNIIHTFSHTNTQEQTSTHLHEEQTHLHVSSL